MPKIIDNVRERAIAEARRLMLEESYENLTIRRVAAGLGVAVGTLYNYFPSKDFLIAGVMLGVSLLFEKFTAQLRWLPTTHPSPPSTGCTGCLMGSRNSATGTARSGCSTADRVFEVKKTCTTSS